MKRCNNCGAFIDDNAQFCTSCGTPYSQSSNMESIPSGNNGQKWYLISGSVLGAIIVGVGLWFGLRGYFDNNVEVQLLQAQPVIWDKFVTPQNNQSTLYEQPDINHVLGQMGEGDIAPVIDETPNFYKIYIGNGKEAWVKKNQCKGIQNAPISQDLISELFLNGQRLECRTITFNDGDLQNLFLFFYRDFSSNGHLEVGIIDNGRLIQPMMSSIDAVALEGRGYELFAGGERPRLEYGTNYQVKEESFERFLNVLELSKKQIADIWKAAQGTDPNKVRVSYYFPSVKAIRFFDVDLNVYGVSASNVKYQEVEGSSTLSGFRYVVDSEYDSDTERTVYDLEVETTSGEKISTGTTDYAVELSIIAQGDYDGNGENEAIVYEWGGGNSLQPPFLVYYDKDKEEFKKTEGFEGIYDNAKIEIEEWKGKTSFIATVGLRKDRYIYQDHSIKLIERISPDVGTRVATVSLSEVFGENAGDMDKDFYIDINGDGEPDKLTFHHDDSHALNWGKEMLLVNIQTSNWCTPDLGYGSLCVSGNIFTFLSCKDAYDVPDILCDDAWIYKYGDGKYELKK